MVGHSLGGGLMQHRNKGRIEHICASTDPVSKVGKLIGTVGHVDTRKLLSHGLDDLNETLNRVKISCYMP